MDITHSNWSAKLHTILQDIAEARFVALDFEFSGISMKKRVKGEDPFRGHKQSVQQRYSDVKSAAEKYQILQVGITAVSQNEETGIYVLKSYNISLSPIVKEQSDIDRQICMGAASIGFLLNNGFDLQKSFAQGVPYLSREEESQTRLEEDRVNSTVGVDLFKHDEDLQHFSFIDKTRMKLKDWLSDENRKNFINIYPDLNYIPVEVRPRSTNIQKRLISQLVRAEFPELVSETYFGSVQVLDRDVTREYIAAGRRKIVLEERLSRQIGMRYVMEALVAGTFNPTGIDHAFLVANAPSRWASEVEKALEGFKSTKVKLSQPTVLIGHNVFTDLVNFYSCFIGQLPDDVQDFRKEIHKLFPMVVDTKYLATKFGNEQEVHSSLADVDADLQNMPLPSIVSHPSFTRYTRGPQRLHEAGYDSFVTARVAIRLSTKLAAMRNFAHTIPRAESKDLKMGEPSETSSGTKTALQELEEIFNVKYTSAKASVPPTVADHSPKKEENLTFAQIQGLQMDKSMPDWSDSFWATNGNRLRINGTLEGILILGD